MRIVKCQQQTAEWLQIRCGRITASRISDVMAILTRKSKNGKAGDPAGKRLAYFLDLIAERLTGQAEENYNSPEMIWGSQNEQFARAAYEIAEGVMVDQVGFILHPEFDYSGASPDSLVGKDGGLEIKAPKTTTHLTWMIAGMIPEEYQLQMQWNMACAEREWWDFVSYDPRVRVSGLRIFVNRLKRDDVLIARIEEQVQKLNSEVDAVMKKLGAPAWVPVLPPPPSPTVRVGALDVPEDIMQLLEQEIIP